MHHVVVLLAFMCILTLYPFPSLSSPTIQTSSDYPRYRFKYLSYDEINSGLRQLSKQYPQYLTLISAHDHYHLPNPGWCRSSIDSVRADVPCEILIAQVGLKPIEKHRPQMLVVGSIHGDERLGALIAYYTVKIMLEHAPFDPWISRLLSKRVLTVIPLPNPSGYDRTMRLEDADGQLVDPNTDFPYGIPRQDQNQEIREESDTNAAILQQGKGNECMRSIAARVLNELFQERLFRIALAFHGKKEFIAYSWGDDTHCQKGTKLKMDPQSSGSVRKLLGIPTDDDDHDEEDDEDQCVDGWQTPDDAAFTDLARGMSAFASSWQKQFYNFGPLNDPLQYKPLNYGGFADWGYAASFNPKHTRTCRPDTYGGYSLYRTRYNNASNRCLTFIIETSADARPPDKYLGSSHGLYARNKKHGNGHVPRNIRLTLFGLDMLQAYVFFLTSHSGTAPEVSRGGLLALHWSVGGAVTVDKTYLLVEIVKANWSITTGVQSGGSMWSMQSETTSNSASNSASSALLFNTKSPFFASAKSSHAHSKRCAYEETLSLYHLIPEQYASSGATLKIRAVAQVDSAWNTQKNPSHFGPQSHLVRARTDSTWHASNGEFEIISSELFYSSPLVINLPPERYSQKWYIDVWQLLILALICFLAPPLIFGFWMFRSGFTTLPASAFAASMRHRFRKVLRSIHNNSPPQPTNM
uniref:Peptidase M14 domain-containing protein n=1 Tax=Timspurckia oligopyrenoides TaxID=708627 RepID=A0A7S0ZF95_9RHOD|mmetsp:Transcript_2900/g.5090  ORF Transcript_2900/g.5090 Transcript_2900/m.5090 type:complete len:695 (+) Transcript_2900:113-2197(+)|eukprot:CAMPEP_0182444998 /NCGR_PEP_ID=MMETSP1172-20130603/3271_1 /TAXON_ID=708627 /ORGANISM="Timspurckia oligopyrenoides, Strain CCMP3278" /LENGTH=694 /DNA_ID=CAMNT_0024640683 /DNA_START=68 /DNA_END=2152 /DNA_ORIENTATION=-